MNCPIPPTHQLFLGTFVCPRQLKHVPDLPPMLPFPHWLAALGEPVEQVTAKFLDQGLIKIADSDAHLDFYLTKEQLQTFLRKRGFPSTGTKKELISRAVQSASSFLPKFDEDKTLYVISSSGKACILNFWDDSGNSEADMRVSGILVKNATKYILAAAIGGTIGNRADAVFVDFINGLLAVKQNKDRIDIQDRFLNCLLRRAETYAQTGQLDKAIEEYTQIIKLRPNWDGLYDARARVYEEKGQLDKVIEDYTQAIKLHQIPSPYSYEVRARVYEKTGQLDKAIEDYTRAITLWPDNLNAYYSRGNAYYKKGQLDKAIEDYTQYIKLKPNDAYGYYIRGLAYEGTGNKKSAIADYRRSLELTINPTDRENTLERLRNLGVRAK